MNVANSLEFLMHVYPGKKITKLPEIDPTEIICEVEPSYEHSDYSVAVACILKYAPHFHKLSTETYLVLKGELKIHIDDKVLIMNDGDTCTVNPHKVHWAEGDFTLVQVTSRPGWAPEDHILSDE